MGDDVHDHGAGLGVGGGTVGVLAAARQPVGAVAEGTQGIGAALIQGARVGLADRTRHRVQALVQGLGIGGQQPGLDVGGPAAVLGWMHIDVAAAHTVFGAPYRGGVIAVDPVVDLVLGLVHRQRPPGGDVGGDFGVDFGQRVGVADQPGA